MTIPIIKHKDDCDQFVDRPGIGSKNDWFVMTEPYPYTAELGANYYRGKEGTTIISVFRDYEDEVDGIELDLRLGCGVCQAISEDTFDYDDFEYVEE